MRQYHSINHYVQYLPENQPFLANALRPWVSPSNARQILHRLVHSGTIHRLSRGVFLKPGAISNVDSKRPSMLEILKTRLPGETIAIHGAEAARILLLTTQMPMKAIFYTSGHTRCLRIGKRVVYLQHVSPRQLLAAGTTAGLVMAALHFIGKSHASNQTVETIKKQLSPQAFQEILQLLPLMPIWMAELFYPYQNK
jgi:hypothetical protein